MGHGPIAEGTRQIDESKLWGQAVPVIAGFALDAQCVLQVQPTAADSTGNTVGSVGVALGAEHGEGTYVFATVEAGTQLVGCHGCVQSEGRSVKRRGIQGDYKIRAWCNRSMGASEARGVGAIPAVLTISNWSSGVMENWSGGVGVLATVHHSNTPILHHSIPVSPRSSITRARRFERRG